MRQIEYPGICLEIPFVSQSQSRELALRRLGCRDGTDVIESLHSLHCDGFPKHRKLCSLPFIDLQRRLMPGSILGPPYVQDTICFQPPSMRRAVAAHPFTNLQRRLMAVRILGPPNVQNTICFQSSEQSQCILFTHTPRKLAVVRIFGPPNKEKSWTAERKPLRASEHTEQHTRNIVLCGSHSLTLEGS